MGNRLYVGNLASSVTKESLTQLFSQAGTVSDVNIIMDRMSGQSRGFGFVEMGSDGEAQEAINQLNGKTLDDRQIVVNEARPSNRRNGGGGGRRFGGGGKGGSGGHRGKRHGSGGGGFNRNRGRY